MWSMVYRNVVFCCLIGIAIGKLSTQNYKLNDENPRGSHYDPNREESVNLRIALPNPNALHVMNLQLFEPYLYQGIEDEIFTKELRKLGAVKSQDKRIKWDMGYDKKRQGMHKILQPIIDKIFMEKHQRKALYPDPMDAVAETSTDRN